MVDRNKNTLDEQLVQAYDFGKTDLAASVKSTIGSRFLGLDVDPSTSRFLDFLFNQALPHVTVQVHEHGGKFIKDTLMNSGLIKDEIRAAELGKAHAGKLAVAVALADPALSTIAAVFDAVSKLNNVRIGLTPSYKGGSTLAASAETLFGSNNEVVQNARSRIYSQLYTEMAGTLARSVVSLPALYAVHSRIKSRVASQTDEIDLELARKDPEARMKYVREHMVKAGTDIDKVLKEEKFKQIKTERTAYEAEFKKFADSRESKKTREEIVKRVTEDYEFAKELDLGHLYKYDREQGTQYGEYKLKEGTTEATIKAELGKNTGIERGINKGLKYRFVEDVKHGEAFDETWVKAEDRNRSRRGTSGKGYTTVVDGIENLYAQMQEQILGKQKAAEQELKGHSKDPSAFNFMEQGTMGLASIIGTQFHKILVGNKKEEYKKPVALNLIMHMREAIHDAKKNQHNIESIANYGGESGDSSFTGYVHKIFKQHQLDCHQSGIGKQYLIHFGFDDPQKTAKTDEEIFQMEDKDLTAYEVAVKHLARAIKEGQLDSISLINLVGQRKIVQKDAKHFGPKGSNGAPSAIIDEINKQCASSACNAGLTQEQLSEILSNIVFSEEELKAGFAANGAFKGDEKAFLFLLLESQIQDDGALNKLTGLSKDEMGKLRTQAQTKFSEHFDAAINAIASMDDKDVATLAKYDVTADDIRTIRQAAESAQEAGKSVNDMVTGEESKQLKTAVANVIMAEEKEDKNFWQNRVKAKASEALNSAVSEALQAETPDAPDAPHHAKLGHKHRHKHETRAGDHLGISP